MAWLWFLWSFIKLMACNISLQGKAKGTFLIVAWISALNGIPRIEIFPKEGLSFYLAPSFQQGKVISNPSLDLIHAETHTHWTTSEQGQKKGREKGGRTGIGSFQNHCLYLTISFVPQWWPGEHNLSIKQSSSWEDTDTANVSFSDISFFWFSFSNLFKLFPLSGIPLPSISYEFSSADCLRQAAFS